jgi:glycosyltransferase involved in cell wall biosynthesis
VELLTFNFDANQYSEIVGEEFPKSVIIHSLGKRLEVEPPFTIYKRRRNFVKLLKEYRDKLEYDYLFSTQSSAPFEPVFLNKAKKNIVFVHFPEIDFDYYRGNLKRKVYLWLFKKWVEQGISKLDMVFCNSNYTREMIECFWKSHGTRDPIVVYPPVNLDKFWCNKSLLERRKRVIYVARFIPMKRHEIMKKLAADFPSYEFVSVGGLIEGEKNWFSNFSENLPQNYTLRTNLPGSDLIETLQSSRIYVHLMEGENFGIAPVEALASGCITLVHNSGRMKEFIPEEFRWASYDDLKDKIVNCMESADENLGWEQKRKELWSKISVLNPETFQNSIWSHIQTSIG